MKVLKSKKILRGLALCCVIVLSLADMIGHGCVNVKAEAPSNPAVKQEAPGTSNVAGKQTPEKRTSEKQTPEKQTSGKQTPEKQTSGKQAPEKQKLPDGITSADEGNPTDVIKPVGEIKPIDWMIAGALSPDGESGLGGDAESFDGVKPDDAIGNGDDGAKDDKAESIKAFSAEGREAKVTDNGLDQPSNKSSSTYVSNAATNTFDLSEGDITIADGTSGTFKVTYGVEAAKSTVVSNSSQIKIITSVAETQYNIEIPAISAKVNLMLSNTNIFTKPKGERDLIIMRNVINLGSGVNTALTLEGDNKMSLQGKDKAGIHVPADATLTIDGSGTLVVKVFTYVPPGGEGYPCAAGIGGDTDRLYENPTSADSGTIIINGGTIDSQGDFGAGIGGGTGGVARNIIINGGTVTGRGYSRSAGIGAGFYNVKQSGAVDRTNLQNITINGGNVTATSVFGGAGIGGGDGVHSGNVTIKGGIVEVPSSAGSNAIGAGNEPMAGEDHFSTGGAGSGKDYGNAVILLAKRKTSGAGGFISDQSQKDNWGGIIFQASEGRVYSTPNITKSFSIPKDYNLTLSKTDGITNNNDITITVDGSVHNEGTINGSTKFICNGRIDNFGSLNNSGDVTVSSSGVIYNGSAAEQGAALIQNLGNATVEVQGDIYNYSRILNDASSKITGSGNIYNLCKMSVDLERLGKPVSATNPIQYGDDLTIRMKVSPGPYVAYEQWLPEQVEVQYKLWNDDKESDLTGKQTVQRALDGTAEITATVRVNRTNTVLWEGGKNLNVGALMSPVGGLQGYITGTATQTVKYDKAPINMTGIVWSKNSFVYDGTAKKVELTGLPSGVTATYTNNVMSEPGTYKVMPTLTMSDPYNYRLINIPTAVQNSLTNGYLWIINKGAVTVTSWPTASEITEGNPLSVSTLTGGAATAGGAPMGGSFAWKNPAEITSWQEGHATQDFDVEFTPADTAHYKNAVGKVALKINPVFYQVTFDPQGGIFKGDLVISVQVAKLVPKPTVPVYEKAVFAGWYEDAAYTMPWDLEKDTVMKDMTLYAKYTASDPLILVAIPSHINIVNDMSKEKGVGNGKVSVKAITDPNIKYPDKTLDIKADSQVILTGEKGAKIKVPVYDGNNSPYDGIGPLISFVFTGKPPVQTEKGFSLEVPINSEKPRDTYQGSMQFQLELK